jgi:hypothetical protein
MESDTPLFLALAKSLMVSTINETLFIDEFHEVAVHYESPNIIGEFVLLRFYFEVLFIFVKYTFLGIS